MPTIPTEYIGSNPFPDRQPQADISPESYGRDAHALSQLGGEVADLGSRLLTARKQAMEHDMVSQMQSDDSTWLPKKTEELRQRFSKKNADGTPVINPDGSVAYDPTGFADALKNEMDNRVNGNLGRLPTGDAQRLYRERTQHMFNGAYAGAYDWENNTRVKTMVNNIELRSQQQNNNIINSNFPYHDSMIELERLRQDVSGAASDGGPINPDYAGQVYRGKAKQTIDAMFGAYSRNPTMAREGLDLIAHITSRTQPETVDGQPAPNEAIGTMFGGDKDARKIADLTDPESLLAYRNRLAAIVKEGYKETKNELKAKVAGADKAYKSNDPVLMDHFTTQDAHALVGQLQDAQQKGIVDKGYARESIVMVAMGEAYKRSQAAIVGMPESDKDKFDARMDSEYNIALKNLGVDKNDPSFIGSYAAHKKMADHLWDEALKQRNKDINEYYENNKATKPGSIKNGIPDTTRLLDRQSEAYNLEVYNQGLLRKVERDDLTKRLKDAASKSGDQAVQMIDEIRAQTGPYATRVMDELTKNGVPHSYITAMNASSPEVARDIIDLSDRERSKAVMDFMDKHGRANIAAEVSKNFLPAQKAINYAGPNGYTARVANDMKELIEKKTALYVMNGKDTKEAAKLASNDIFYDNYTMLSNGTVYMPKRIGTTYTDQKLVDAAMQQIYKPGAQSGLQLPGSAIGLNKEERAARLQASINTGRWVTDKDESRAIFMVKDKHGMLSQPLLMADGKTPVSVDFVDASKNPTPEMTNDANVRFWEPKLGPDGKPMVDLSIGGAVQAVKNLFGKKNQQKLDEQIIESDNFKPGEAPAETDSGREPNSYTTDFIKPVDEVDTTSKPDAQLPQDVKKPPTMEANAAKQADIGVDVSKLSPKEKEELHYYDLAKKAAEKYGLPINEFWKQIKQESGLNPKAKSAMGAVGLMQFMPDTAPAYGMKTSKLVNGKLVDERTIPEKSIEGGARYLSELYKQFGSLRGALAAYNMGPYNLQTFLKYHKNSLDEAEKSKRWPLETKKYLKAILGR